MNFFLNELSLCSQYSSFNDFKDHLIEVLKMLKITGELNCRTLKKYDFYNYPFMQNQILQNVLRERDDAITRFKSILSASLNNDFWETEQVHDSGGSYVCNLTNLLSNYSLAEASERDRLSISFQKCPSAIVDVEIIKNGAENILVKNFIKYRQLLDFFYEKEIISSADFCSSYFKDSKISFDKLIEGFGFDILDPSQTKIFIDSFKQFELMSWEEIIASDGLKFKPYTPKVSREDIFRGTAFAGKTIFKFRTNQKMRCFGYRDENIFYALKFEIDHSASDGG